MAEEESKDGELLEVRIRIEKAVCWLTGCYFYFVQEILNPILESNAQPKMMILKRSPSAKSESNVVNSNVRGWESMVCYSDDLFL